ncbi:uncharacterized protein LOC124271361 [Haliotis rubra]|uniref:uncharacterized protein LOC124271361 n=1 Tax=Haliotis rubra TaxID=36100 RepID=UPI001EE59612|nr:uncharacterized protein LOC124271361 [Haliotis rubra]
MERQVNAVSRSCFYQIRNISKIRKYIDEETCKKLVHSLVTSRLDYGNALFAGIPKSLMRRLQRVQNASVRLITRSRKWEHVTEARQALHWLPVHLRCQYKILTYTFTALHGTAPAYLQVLITPYNPTRSLRSESASLLTVPRKHTARYGERCFHKTASTLWNTLPVGLRTETSITNFKKNIKTYLFKCE